jgi:5-methylcytosine-specific restriction endonuclease McrA
MRHKDRTQARVLAYRARKRAAGPAFTPDDVTAQHNRQKGKCFYCGKSLNGVYDIDHVMPLALGGSNGPENIVLACPHCNGSKHAKHPMDFAGILF